MLKTLTVVVIVGTLIGALIGFAGKSEETSVPASSSEVLEAPIITKSLSMNVPKKLVAQLVKCINRDTCQLPRQQLRVQGVEISGVEFVSDGMHYIFSTNDSMLKVTLIDDTDGQKTPLAWEDSGTGAVSRFIAPDVVTHQVQTFTADDEVGATLLPLVQVMHYLLMQIATEKLIPLRTL